MSAYSAATAFPATESRDGKALLWSVLLTKLFPRVVVIVPFFVTLRNLQIMNTYQGLILVYLMVTFPVAIWLLKGFFDKIPSRSRRRRHRWLFVASIALVGRVADGAASPGRGRNVSFILAWNEFLFALVFTNGLERRPISVALAFFVDENGINGAN